MSETLDWLRTSPLLGIFLTLLGYRLGLEVRRLSRDHALAQPVLIAIVFIGVALELLDVDYSDYSEGAGIIGFFLGPATVALAVPLHRQAHHLGRMFVPMLIALPVGAVVSIVTGVLAVRVLGGDRVLELTMAPKAATTPVSLAVSDTIGGLSSLTAVLAIVVGIIGAVAAPAVLTAARVRDRRARGLAIGAVSHGIGTSRALREDATEGAFSGLSMGITALLISALVPVVLHFL
ncbi:LrgB family protein [Nocardioides cavernaquae]|uniref:LrgB family protein n=1 Tax=Nocardioides cavernaquae TaxID=2321396 RepID=A0A3A5HDR3_9ACTN|nr:LrgB family protein [Nocardioides cavernaquae]RJS46174.1 LrgB family protein [Nocardioides cavernaquae]